MDKIPAAVDGLVPTLNKMGWMTTELDSFSSAFVDFAPKGPGPALDIGAAYGVASIAALKAGAKVIANDLDQRHLEILLEQAPENLRQSLTLMPGAFPEALGMPDNSLGSILCARVLHFFDGPTMESSIHKMFSMLSSGGKAFVVGETVYLKSHQHYIPEFEKRVQDSTCRWPGFFDDVHRRCAPEYRDILPPQIHFFDVGTLRREFEMVGFAVETAETFARPEFSSAYRLDGRESAGLIARKP